MPMNSVSSLVSSSASSSASSPTSGQLEKTHLRLGFVALSDAAPLVAAKLLEFGHAHGLTLELSRQPSWAAVRDKLLSGDLEDRKSTRLNSSHMSISYAVFC